MPVLTAPRASVSLPDVRLKFVRDNAGRPSDLAPDYPDCGARACAIALRLDYGVVADELLGLALRHDFSNGIPDDTLRNYLLLNGWPYRDRVAPLASLADMTGPRVVFLAAQDEGGRLSHVTAMINGTIRDIADCRDGLVVGYSAPLIA